MKGIVLAGGTGTRLYPLTLGTCKQLLPIYNKPLIYYSLSVLMLAGIRDILLITTPQDKQRFYNVLGDGENFGIRITYGIQSEPGGIAQAFLIGEEFIGNSSVALILGDNIFWGHNFINILKESLEKLDGAYIFGYPVKNPSIFGIAEIDSHDNVIGLIEKPKNPKSNIAVAGLYFYNNDVVSIAKTVKPSSRGELEITSINQVYLEEKKLKIKLLGRGYAWMDAGTFEGMFDASNFIYTFEKRQGNMIGCIEEIAFNNKWIDKEKLLNVSKVYKNEEYGLYLNSLINR